MSKLRDRSHRHDVFHRRAKQQGFVARSVFKLEEIDQKYRLLRRGGRVLDLGCKPGSGPTARSSGSTARRSTSRSPERASSLVTSSQ